MPTVFDGVPRLENFDIHPALSAFAGARQMRNEEQQLSEEQQAKVAGVIAQGARSADTPEKWGQFIQTLQRHFPGRDLSAFQDFSARDAAVAMDPNQITPYQEAQLGNERERIAIARAAAARAGSGGGMTPYQQEQIRLSEERLNLQRDKPAKPPGPPSVTTQKAILEADEAIMAGEGVIQSLQRALEINDKAYSGPGAETIGYGASILGTEGGQATEEIKNIVTAQALAQLKTVFGAMPTEGERKILLEIQGSVNQAPEVRKGIWERAIGLAKRRMDFNRERAKALRSGDYYSPEEGGDVVPQDSGMNSLETIEGDIDPAQVLIDQANEAIAAGADPEAVQNRLRELGVEFEPY